MLVQKKNNIFYDKTGCDSMSEGHPITPRFEHYTSAEMYKKAGLKGYAPMTAKEIDTEGKQDEFFNSSDYVIEEKFDGTRALLYFLAEKPLKWQSNREEYLVKHSLQVHGSSFTRGKDRIYDFFLANDSVKERADFLKNEFGIGGCTALYPDDTKGWINYNAKGYEITYDETERKNFSWTEIAKILSQMIDAGEFYPQKGYTRCFSRRVSEKTKWYCENTDSLPQLRGLNIPELKDTILDGEMFIPNRPFKDVSSTLNCKWDKAIDRQLELGYIVFHAFDILFYKGIDLRKMPLERRKFYLQLAVCKIDSPYVKMVDYQSCGNLVCTVPYHETHGTVPSVCQNLEYLNRTGSYPTLYYEYLKNKGSAFLSPRAFYEYIVASGGEGVMIKPKDGKYFHKRGREYQKVKKFLTREVIIMGFTNPTDEYKGKFPTIDKWDYWETTELDKVDLSGCTSAEREQFKKNWYPEECRPISKHYCMNWVGTIRFGVAITPEEMFKLPKNKKFNIEEMILEGDDVLVLEVGECSGFDEDTRKMFSDDPDSWVGKVIEVKANEIFKDTGKLRHPRYMRVREDKSPIECIYKDHISG